MEGLLTEFLVAVLTAFVSIVLTWFRREAYDIRFEDLYSKYRMVFEVSGELVKAMDEKLYVEMGDCVQKMKQAYESPEFTPSMFNQIVKECKDVFDRAEQLLKGE